MRSSIELRQALDVIVKALASVQLGTPFRKHTTVEDSSVSMIVMYRQDVVCTIAFGFEHHVRRTGHVYVPTVTVNMEARGTLPKMGLVAQALFREMLALSEAVYIDLAKHTIVPSVPPPRH